MRPGLVVLNPERMREDQIPAVLSGWDVIWCPEMVDTGFVGPHPRASIWQGMNFIMINPDLAVVNELRPARTLCGGFHCVPLDVRRTGSRQDYS